MMFKDSADQTFQCAITACSRDSDLDIVLPTVETRTACKAPDPFSGQTRL